MSDASDDPTPPCVWCGEVPTLIGGAWRCEDATCPRWGSLLVYTARIGAAGLDITRKSGRGDALAFAPSWTILRPALDARARAAEASKLWWSCLAETDEGPAILAAAWEAYVPAYLAEMRASYRAHRPAWQALFARGKVTLLCYCTDPERCHRTLLARDILPKLGAVYMGEHRSPQLGLFGGAR